ncbi:MAG: SDR family oxidoreductase [Ignavibacteriae bacterium]|nr:SDR family oxidoreductase [Ignavibacteriota bacterium]MCB9217594.1 SDR family oxidoreductase [Ignavibacteria bacterium]
MILDLTGIRALVTGGTRGIGKAITQMLAAGGARVAVNYKSKSGPADELSRLLGERHFEHMMLRADLTQERAVGTMVKRIDESWGGLDLLVVNHGIWERGAIGEMNLADWKDTINTNLTAPFIVINETLRLLFEEKPSAPKRIIFIASSAGIRGEAEHAHYAASKGGLIAMMKSLAVELAPQGVTVNAVAPGWIETEMTGDYLDTEGNREKILGRIPLRRIGTPEEVAAAVLFLASRQAGFINGHVLRVNGGETI